MDKDGETECSLLDCQHQMIDNPAIRFAIVLVFFSLYKFSSFFSRLAFSLSFLSSFFLINILSGCFALIDRSTMVHDDFIGLVFFYPHPILIFVARRAERRKENDMHRKKIFAEHCIFSPRDESSVNVHIFH